MRTNVMSALNNGITIDTNDIKHAKKLGINFGLHIGCGTYSHVYKVKYVSTPDNISVAALKICDKTGAVKRLVDNELSVFEILREKPHKNIIKFLQKYENYDQNRIWVLMECFNGVDMAEKLMRSSGPFEESVAKSYFKQLVEGLKFLHSLSIVHRDIKLDNILVGFDGCTQQRDGHQKECIKIIDFGFAKIVELKEGSALCRSRLGTEVYMAPEVLDLNNDDYDAFKSDIFSLAIVLFAFVFKCFPERQLTANTSEQQLTNSGVIQFPDLNEHKVSESVKQLILNMSCEDSSHRFNINQILDSEWIRN